MGVNGLQQVKNRNLGQSLTLYIHSLPITHKTIQNIPSGSLAVNTSSKSNLPCPVWSSCTELYSMDLVSFLSLSVVSLGSLVLLHTSFPLLLFTLHTMIYFLFTDETHWLYLVGGCELLWASSHHLVYAQERTCLLHISKSVEHSRTLWASASVAVPAFVSILPCVILSYSIASKMLESSG